MLILLVETILIPDQYTPDLLQSVTRAGLLNASFGCPLIILFQQCPQIHLALFVIWYDNTYNLSQL
jgi:hypothetical protein